MANEAPTPNPLSSEDKNMAPRMGLWSIFFALGIIIAVRAKRGFWIGLLIAVAMGMLGTGIGLVVLPPKRKEQTGVCGKYIREITEGGLTYRYIRVSPAKTGGGYIALYAVTSPQPQGGRSAITKSITKQEYDELIACQ